MNKMLRNIKKISLLLVVLVLSFNFAGCKDESKLEENFTGENPFSSEFINDESVMFAYGFGLVSPDEEELIKYEGKPIEIEYYIDNIGATMSAGMSIFINGVPQAYKVEGSNDETYMHIENVKEKSVKRIKISFKPVIGRKGETLNVRFISILNPQIRPNKLEYLFAHTNSMTTFFPRKLQMLDDSPATNNYSFTVLPSQREMTKEELEKVIYTDSKGNQVNKLKRFNFFVTDTENINQSYITNNDGRLNITIQSYGGPQEKYLIIPYINHKAFSSDLFPSILSVESGNKLFEQTFSIIINDIDKTKYNIQEYNIFYILAIPLSGSTEADPVISKSLVFKVE